MKSTSRLNELDALRGIAALSVLGYHYTTRYKEIFGIDLLNGFEFSYGYLGVELFFMISGFVIFMTAGKVKNVKEFLIKRIIRLYPAYWICLSISFIVLSIFPIAERPVNLKMYLVNLTMFQEIFKVRNLDGAYWSLFIEWMFYIIISITIAVRIFGKPVVWLGIWLFVSVVNSFYRLPFSDSFLNLHYAPYFVSGVSLYLTWESVSSAERKNRIYWLFILAAGVTIALQNVPIPNKLSYWIFVLIFLLFIYGKLKWLATPSLVWLGGISYVLYLIHTNIGYELIRLFRPLGGPASLIVSTVLILLLSFFINAVLERKLTKWLKRKLIRSKK